jgi:hypothetical protein
MTGKMTRFWLWLFAEHYSEVAKCRECGAVVTKTRMVKEPVYGWFCNEEECEEYWLRIQK